MAIHHPAVANSAGPTLFAKMRIISADKRARQRKTTVRPAIDYTSQRYMTHDGRYSCATQPFVSIMRGIGYGISRAARRCFCCLCEQSHSPTVATLVGPGYCLASVE